MIIHAATLYNNSQYLEKKSKTITPNTNKIKKYLENISLEELKTEYETINKCNNLNYFRASISKLYVIREILIRLEITNNDSKDSEIDKLKHNFTVQNDMLTLIDWIEKLPFSMQKNLENTNKQKKKINSQQVSSIQQDDELQMDNFSNINFTAFEDLYLTDQNNKLTEAIATEDSEFEVFQGLIQEKLREIKESKDQLQQINDKIEEINNNIIEINNFFVKIKWSDTSTNLMEIKKKAKEEDKEHLKNQLNEIIEKLNEIKTKHTDKIEAIKNTIIEEVESDDETQEGKNDIKPLLDTNETKDNKTDSTTTVTGDSISTKSGIPENSTVISTSTESGTTVGDSSTGSGTTVGDSSTSTGSSGTTGVSSSTGSSETTGGDSSTVTGSETTGVSSSTGSETTVGDSSTGSETTGGDSSTVAGDSISTKSEIPENSTVISTSTESETTGVSSSTGTGGSTGGGLGTGGSSSTGSETTGGSSSTGSETTGGSSSTGSGTVGDSSTSTGSSGTTGGDSSTSTGSSETTGGDSSTSTGSSETTGGDSSTVTGSAETTGGSGSTGSGTVGDSSTSTDKTTDTSNPLTKLLIFLGIIILTTGVLFATGVIQSSKSEVDEDEEVVDKEVVDEDEELEEYYDDELSQEQIELLVGA